MMTKERKLICVAIIFAILGIVLPESTTSTSNNTTGVIWVVNNTNLAPFAAGHGGTGERLVNNTTYWNNNSPIQIFLYSHANTTGTAAEIHLFINGTKVADTSGRALGVAEQSNRSIVATIPQYSYYSAEFVNYHHIEWYEYKILTGNVTTTSGSIDQTQLDLKINKSGDILPNNFIFRTNDSMTYLESSATYFHIIRHNIAHNHYAYALFGDFFGANGYYDSLNSSYNEIYYSDELVGLFSDDGTGNITQLYTTPKNANIEIGSANYSFNSTDANWNGANLTNVNNITSNGLQLNRMSKNNTADAYGSYINIGSPFANFSGDIEKYLDLSSATNFIWQVTNTTTGYASRIDMYAYSLQLQVSDGINNFILIDTEDVSIVSNTGNYTFNSTDANWNTANIINVNNVSANTIKFLSDGQTITEQVNSTQPTAATSQATNGIIRFSTFTPSVSFQATYIGARLSTSASSNIQVALYASNATGYPGALLNSTGNLSVANGLSNQTVIGTISNTSLTAGTKYWIATQTQAATTTVYYQAGTSSPKYQTYTYQAFPSTATPLNSTEDFAMVVGYNSTSAGKILCLKATYAGSLYAVDC